ncbi:MAG TPA: sulfotransferase [Stellaceae bacterium]|jgi:tetratricopeptide (TPR) repeat protein
MLWKVFSLGRRPRSVEAVFQQALALHRRGRLAEAEAVYRDALQSDPEHADALYNLGLIRLHLGARQDALRLLANALRRKPDSAEAHNAVAVALRQLNRPRDALVYFGRALAISPDFAEAHNNLGATLQQLGQHSEALRHFERALAINPGLAEAHHGRGTALRTLGPLDEARRAIERGIELAPRRAEFYRSLGELKEFAPGDPHVAQLEMLARNIASLSEEEQTHLHFTLGKMYADLGQHPRSFGHLVAGNALKRRATPYDERAVLAQLEQTRRLFSAEVIRAREGLGDPSPVPIFIFGMPRSGTTLVEQILASHPRVHGGGELRNFETAVASLAGPAGVPPDIGETELRRLGAHYLEGVRALAPAAARISDKMPINFRFAGLIHLALPNARLIHMCRDPIDTCLSCFSILFGGEQPHTYDLAELGRYYRAYARLMEHWREVLPPGVMLDIRYEDVVADIEREARRIVAHCGLEWHDACLDFHRTQRPVHTASSAQVRRPIYRSSIGRRRPPDDMLAPLLEALDGTAS